MRTTSRPVGELLREWRQRRRLSQLDLALDADISARHLSFIETGRAQPSRQMLLHLSEQLDVPLRERNALLLAAGYAPHYSESPLDGPALSDLRSTIERLVEAHEPYPALAVDRHWRLVTANAGVERLLAGCAPALLAPPVNVLRLSLHPEGLSPRIVNLGQWRRHVLTRLKRQAAQTADPVLEELWEELSRYPAPPPQDEEINDIAVPLRLISELGVLSFIGTTMVFGTPRDVTLSELAIELFLPADSFTQSALAAP